jgi:hypothetical protein
MRAAWFRGRHPAADEQSLDVAVERPVDAGGVEDDPVEPIPSRLAPPEAGGGSTAPVPPVRPVHGHPTF